MVSHHPEVDPLRHIKHEHGRDELGDHAGGEPDFEDSIDFDRGRRVFNGVRSHYHHFALA